MNTVVENSLPDLRPHTNGGNFKSLSVSYQSKPIAISLGSFIKKQNISPHFEIEFVDFDYKFSFEIAEIKRDLLSNAIALYLKFSNNTIKIVLSGDWQNDEELYINDFGFSVEKQGQTPTAAFLLNTLWAMLGLSAKVRIQIPDSNQAITVSFDINLNKINEFLQIKQIAYRLMVIEKTFKITLPFPQIIESEDIENIAFCYHAIVEREFDWLCNTLTFFPASTKGYGDLLPPTNTSFPITIPAQEEERTIFGYSLKIGQFFIKIDQVIVVNYEEAKQKLLALSGEPVKVIVKSLNGKMWCKAVKVPALPKNAFSSDIQTLIDLEEKLDSRYFEKYLDSFSDAFEGLTNEQIEAITERPTLEEEAFNF